jgi:protein SCO1/2
MTRLRIGPLGIAALCALGSLTLTACGGGSSAGSPITVNSPPSQSAFRGAVVSPGLALPSVSLTDTSGRGWNLATKARGRVTAVYFGYTHCPDVCPTDMADLATARRSLPPELRDKVDIVFITVDQKRDTRPVIRTWLDRFDKSLVGLTGNSAQLGAAAHALHVPYRATTTAKGLEQVEHGSQMTAFAPDGVSRLIWLDGTAVGDIANDMRLLATGQVPA